MVCLPVYQSLPTHMHTNILYQAQFVSSSKWWTISISPKVWKEVGLIQIIEVSNNAS